MCYTSGMEYIAVSRNVAGCELVALGDSCAAVMSVWVFAPSCIGQMWFSTAVLEASDDHHHIGRHM
jgi:hypothetical protein